MGVQHIYLGRQPIINRSEQLVAFELLFRDRPTGGANICDDLTATANVIVNAFDALGLQSVLGPHRGFLNVSMDFLLGEPIRLLPKNQIVLEILDTVAATPAIVRRCTELKCYGYQLALDDLAWIDERERALLPVADIIKVDLQQVPDGTLQSLVAELQHWPGLKLAEKVESREQAECCRALGFDLFQGYYFGRPEILRAERTKAANRDELQCERQFALSDAVIEPLNEQFKHNPVGYEDDYLTASSHAYVGNTGEVIELIDAMKHVLAMTSAIN